MSDNDSEVERTIVVRPPSSYGSMCSDDPDEDVDKFEDAAQPVIKVNLPTRVKLYRPGSPESGVTSVTQDQQTSVHNEGVYITVQRSDEVPVPVEVTMTVEDDESSVFASESQDEENDSQHTHTHAPATHFTHELKLPFIFKAMVNTLRTLNSLELQCLVRSLCTDVRLDFCQLVHEGEMDALDVVDRMLEQCDKEEVLDITVRALYDISRNDLAASLEHVCGKVLLQFKLRANHKHRYYSLYEGTCRPGKQRYIRHVYVESPVVLETPGSEETPVLTRDLFSPLWAEGHVRVVVTTGLPAVGLTVTVQMFLIDWAERQAYQNFQFVFAFPGRELHLVKNSDQTFLQFLAAFCPEAKQADFLSCPDCRVLFVIDALELCKQPLNFTNNPRVTDITTPAPVDALLTSLIAGDLLPHACVWITAHRTACRKIPENYISKFTRLKGFGDAQKQEYFTKRTVIGNQVLDRVRASERLYDACYLPLFCWIVSVVYEHCLQNPPSARQAPTLATFYLQYVIVLTNRKIERYVGAGINASRWSSADRDFLMKMGELALRMLQKNHNVFYEDSVSGLALDIHHVTHKGGLSFETVESTRENGRSFRFVHPSVQTFMAAMYVYVRFRLTGENAFIPQTDRTRAAPPVSNLYKPAIDRALGSSDANMDLFLHFLLGLLAPKTDMHLRGHLLPQYHPEPQGIEEVLRHGRKRIMQNSKPERCRNLELCLSELEKSIMGKVSS